MRVHFMGIAGSGSSAAAEIAKAYGFKISGCDLSLEGHNVSHLYCHSERSEESQDSSRDFSPSARNDNLVDILAITPAVTQFDPNNPELKEARKLGIEVLTWQEFTGRYLLRDKFVIAVTGTHGKSTTTAMIAKLLEDANLDPTVLLGAEIPQWGKNYRIPHNQNSVIASEAKQSGSENNSTKIASSPSAPRNDELLDYFVIEADEAYDNFLSYEPNISVVTNIEMDHPEYFRDLNAVKESFEKFLLGTKQTIVANIQDANVAEILKDIMKQSKITAIDYTKHELNMSLQIPGGFNLLNTQAAFQVGLLLGIDTTIIRKSLSSFTGVGRRFEYIGSYKGREVYSDFGHHPTEIKATMDAAREKFPDKYIWLIFQPHMFSRTKALFKDFVEVFKNLPVNQALIMDIYPSREVDTGLVSSQGLVDAVDNNKVDYISGVDELKVILNKEIRPGDIIFFMGAGDIDQMARGLLSLV